MNCSVSVVNSHRAASRAASSRARTRAQIAGNSRDGRLRVRLLAAVFALGIAACGSGGNRSGPNVAAKDIIRDSHTAILNWTPVRNKTDRTTLTNLAGYKVYYGTSPHPVTAVVLSNPTLTTYQITNLSSGTWYFAVAAYTSDGIEGVQSNVASKTVQ
jgi:hypothetical protein